METKKRRDKAMTRSKLERYLSILEVLVPRPSRFDKISYEVKTDIATLKQHLDFLILHKLVEERPSKKGKSVFAVTERGLAVFKTLRAQKYLQKLRSIMPVVEEADEIQSLLSKASSTGEPET
jgi:predicted transcriptional regulator